MNRQTYHLKFTKYQHSMKELAPKVGIDFSFGDKMPTQLRHSGLLNTQEIEAFLPSHLETLEALEKLIQHMLKHTLKAQSNGRISS